MANAGRAQAPARGHVLLHTVVKPLTLEVELDLPLDADGVRHLLVLLNRGLGDAQAAKQLAQDLLGSTGAVVQAAQVCAT
jgi:hypothetical protein